MTLTRIIQQRHIQPAIQPAWTKFEFVISGLPNGTIPQKHRVGFRYYVKNGGPSGSVSDEIGIDDFDFTSN